MSMSLLILLMFKVFEHVVISLILLIPFSPFQVVFLLVIIIVIIIVIIVTAGQGVEVGEPLHDLLHVHLVVVIIIVFIPNRMSWLLSTQTLAVGLIGLLQLALNEGSPLLPLALGVGLHVLLVSVLHKEVAYADHSGHVPVTELSIALVLIIRSFSQFDEG